MAALKVRFGEHWCPRQRIYFHTIKQEKITNWQLASSKKVFVFQPEHYYITAQAVPRRAAGLPETII